MFKILMALWLAIVALFTGCGKGNNPENPELPETTTSTSEETTVDATTPTVPTEEEFKVIYLDVGQADAALITCGEKSMLIDGGNAADSNVIYTVLNKYNIDTLEYVVATHAHEDHIGGLSGAFRACNVKNVLCPVTDYNSKTFDNFKNSVSDQELTITIPTAGTSFSLGSAKVDVFGPCKTYEDTNDTSIVLKITYGETSFLFTGDAGYEAEHDMINAGYDLSATVLKVGHHGSSTSSSYVFLREVMPKYAIISVGEDNNYGHPHEDALSRFRDANAKIYRTDMQGDIICISDGKTVTISTNRNTDVDTNPTTPADGEYVYVGNIKNHKLHKITCSSLPAEHNRAYFYNRDEAFAAGYTSTCGSCKP